MAGIWTYQQLQLLGQMGLSESGLTRLAYSWEDDLARRHVMTLMKESGLQVREDYMGNILARLPGKEDRAPIVTGSHLDTVPDGGLYDGALGVLGGLEALREIRRRGGTRKPLELIVFAAEESSRFGVATLGSKFLAGKLPPDIKERLLDQEGYTLGQILTDKSWHWQTTARTPYRGEAFVELHIEQGPVLDEEGITIGLVEAIAAPVRLRLIIHGEAAHSGATPMGRRRDALVAASQLVIAVEQAAEQESACRTVATVGQMQVLPGVMNVVPGEARLSVDIRGTDAASRQRVVEAVLIAADGIAKKRQVNVTRQVLSEEDPVPLHAGLVAELELQCQHRGFSYLRMASGAGHDAMNMAAIMPAAMIFIPCRRGISHNPEEFAEEAAVCRGVELLTEFLYAKAQ